MKHAILRPRCREIARGWRAGVRTGNSRAGWRAPETQAARKALFTIRGCTRAGRKAVRYVTAGCDGKHAGETALTQETSSPRIHADLHGQNQVCHSERSEESAASPMP